MIASVIKQPFDTEHTIIFSINDADTVNCFFLMLKKYVSENIKRIVGV